MGQLYRIKYGQGEKSVVAAAATNLNNVAVDEVALFVGDTVTKSQVDQLDMIDGCRCAFREAGYPAPTTTDLTRVDLNTGQSRVDASIVTGATRTTNEARVTLCFGSEFPRATSKAASLLFDEAIGELIKAWQHAMVKI